MQASEHPTNYSTTTSPTSDEGRWLRRQSFLIWCPEAGQNRHMAATAIHTLYYLPLNFMLMLPRAAANHRAVDKDKPDQRLRFYRDSALSGEELALLADAIVCSEDAQPKQQTSAKFVFITGHHTVPTKDPYGNFTIGANNAEALASVLLQIAAASA